MKASFSPRPLTTLRLLPEHLVHTRARDQPHYRAASVQAALGPQALAFADILQ